MRGDSAYQPFKNGQNEATLFRDAKQESVQDRAGLAVGREGPVEKGHVGTSGMLVAWGRDGVLELSTK